MKATLIALALFALPMPLLSQELVEDEMVTMKARVLEVISSEVRAVPGTSVESLFQSLRVRILDGAQAGKEVTVENDFLELREGDVFYLMHTTNSIDGTDHYSVRDPYRLPWLGALFVLFLAVVLFFGGKQGLRGLLALGGGLFFIVFLLLPGILHGYSPVLVSVGVAALIIVLGSYVTHGFTRTTTTAVIGMVATVILTSVLAQLSIVLTRLSGFSEDEAIYLSFNTGGELDLAGLLLGGMIIGALGVLYDAAIGQSVAVEELTTAAPELSRFEIYKRALRIGREHVGALVNTLAIAYVGAALPLLLLFYGFGSESLEIALNREIFATEIVRTLVGSIGIILVVPITTLVATRMLVKSAH